MSGYVVGLWEHCYSRSFCATCDAVSVGFDGVVEGGKDVSIEEDAVGLCVLGTDAMRRVFSSRCVSRALLKSSGRDRNGKDPPMFRVTSLAFG